MSFFKLGTMTLGSFFKKSPTRKYPKVKREPYQRTRGSIEMLDIKSCSFCSVCAKKCPADAIEVNRAEEIWTIHPFDCIACEACVHVCPKGVLGMSNVKTSIAVSKEPIVVKRPERTPEELAELKRKEEEKQAKIKAAKEAAAKRKAQEA